MDFTTLKYIDQDIEADYEPLKFAGGYDHNWVLNHKEGELALCAKAVDEASGRVMEVYTDLPGIQFYTGNFLSPMEGKEKAVYDKRQGYCFETESETKPQPTTAAQPQPTTAAQPQPTTAAQPQPTTTAQPQPTTAAQPASQPTSAQSPGSAQAYPGQNSSGQNASSGSSSSGGPGSGSNGTQSSPGGPGGASGSGVSSSPGVSQTPGPGN